MIVDLLLNLGDRQLTSQIILEFLSAAFPLQSYNILFLFVFNDDRNL